MGDDQLQNSSAYYLEKLVDELSSIGVEILQDWSDPQSRTPRIAFDFEYGRYAMTVLCEVKMSKYGFAFMCNLYITRFEDYDTEYTEEDAAELGIECEDYGGRVILNTGIPREDADTICRKLLSESEELSEAINRYM